MSGSAIPTMSRATLQARDHRTCVVCASGNGIHWHHRRSRRVKDAHQHCACVGITLCPTCHDKVHRDLTWAYGRGLLISVHITEPSTIPVKTFYGWVTMTCDGRTRPIDPPPGKEV